MRRLLKVNMFARSENSAHVGDSVFSFEYVVRFSSSAPPRPIPTAMSSSSGTSMSCISWRSMIADIGGDLDCS